MLKQEYFYAWDCGVFMVATTEIHENSMYTVFSVYQYMHVDQYYVHVLVHESLCRKCFLSVILDIMF